MSINGSICFVRLAIARERKAAEEVAQQALNAGDRAAGTPQDQLQTLPMEIAPEAAARFGDFSVHNSLSGQLLLFSFFFGSVGGGEGWSESCAWHIPMQFDPQNGPEIPEWDENILEAICFTKN